LINGEGGHKRGNAIKGRSGVVQQAYQTKMSQESGLGSETANGDVFEVTKILLLLREFITNSYLCSTAARSAGILRACGPRSLP
jgi:hypothetical protein